MSQRIIVSIVAAAALFGCEILNPPDEFTGTEWEQDEMERQLDGTERILREDISEHLLAVDFADEQYGWILSDSAVYHTNDGGETW